MFALASTCRDGHRNYCKACHKLKKDEWRAKNLEHHNQKGRAWAKANKEKRSQVSKEYKATNKEKCVALEKAWKQQNKERVNLSTAVRRKRVRQATPAWSDKKAIKSIYLEAIKNKLEVDHIIPLQGKMVSGLHVPSNLRLVTKSENSSKGNKYAV